jgi:hypothetical protein
VTLSNLPRLTRGDNQLVVRVKHGHTEKVVWQQTIDVR